MVSQLAKGDYEDMMADGLSPTLEDFDRLNRLAMRLTDGAETTAANFPRVGWAGDVPFFQPTCAAFAWYLQFVERSDFDTATKDACWFFALANGRVLGAFDDLDDAKQITNAVNDWLASLPVTRDEIARACRYAAVGFDDAEPAKADAAKASDAAKSDAEKREESLANLDAAITTAAALTGIAPSALMSETPSRLARMVEAVRANNPMGGGETRDVAKLRADYDLTYREIRRRLVAEKSQAASCVTGAKTPGEE